MGPNGCVFFDFYATVSSVAVNKTLQIKLGADIMAGENYSTVTDIPGHVQICNRNSVSSQVGSAYKLIPAGSTKGSPYTSTTDTSASSVVSLVAYTAAEAALTITGDTGDASSCTVTMASGAPAVGRYLYVSSGTGCGTGTQNVGTYAASTYTSNVTIATSNGTTTFTYPCTCNGGTPIGAVVQLLPIITLEDYSVIVRPAN
jgi:hypothetical protein